MTPSFPSRRSAGLLKERRRGRAGTGKLFGVSGEVVPDGETGGAGMAVGCGGPPPAQRRSFAPIAPIEDDDDEDIVDEAEDEEDEEKERPARRERDEGEGEKIGRASSRERVGQHV